MATETSTTLNLQVQFSLWLEAFQEGCNSHSTIASVTVSVVDTTATSTRKFASAYHDVVTLEAVCCSNTKPLPSQTTIFNLADHTI